MRGAIEVRSAIAHCLGQLTRRRIRSRLRMKAAQASVREAAILVSDEIACHLHGWCVDYMVWLDSQLPRSAEGSGITTDRDA